VTAYLRALSADCFLSVTLLLFGPPGRSYSCFGVVCSEGPGWGGRAPFDPCSYWLACFACWATTQGHEVRVRILCIWWQTMLSLSISHTNLLAIRIGQTWNWKHFYREGLLRRVEVLLWAKVWSDWRCPLHHLQHLLFLSTALEYNVGILVRLDVAHIFLGSVEDALLVREGFEELW